MINSATYKSVCFNVPKEIMLERFINTRPSVPAISEEDIMNEVRAVRYAK